jgi:hypothetical protein
MKKAIDKGPENGEALFRLLELYLVNGLSAEALDFASSVFQISKEINEPGLHRLVLERMLQSDVEESLVLKYFALFRRQSHVLTRVIDQLDSIGEQLAKKTDHACLASYLYKDLALYYFGDVNNPSLRIAALHSWQRCLDLSKNTRWKIWYPSQMAAKLISAHHFEHSRKFEELTHLQNHVYGMTAMTTVGSESPFVPSAAKAHLAAYHVNNNDAQRARALFRTCMDSAFDILSDDDKDNDYIGIVFLADSFLHCGDDLNALSAWCQLVPHPDKGNVMSWLLQFNGDDDDELVRSLTSSLIATMEEKCSANMPLKPDQIDFVLQEIKKRISDESRRHDFTESDHPAQKTTEASSAEIPTDIARPLPENSRPPSQVTTAYAKIKARVEHWSEIMTYMSIYCGCDGCGAQWDFENAMHVCKYCFHTGFCQTCVAKLREGSWQPPSIGSLVCNGTHKWLYLPKWNKEMYMRSLQANVMTGGQIMDSQRVDGKLVSTTSWLEDLKTSWGFL